MVSCIFPSIMRYVKRKMFDWNPQQRLKSVLAYRSAVKHREVHYTIICPYWIFTLQSVIQW